MTREPQALARKTRSLKKYEAASDPVARLKGAPPMELFSPFGPLIARSQLEVSLVERLNRYEDVQFRDGAMGEALVPPEVAFEGGEASLMRRTQALVHRYVEASCEGELARVRIDVFWIMRQGANTPSPLHFHSGDISGVLYLRTPQLDERAGEGRQNYISGRKAGYINFLIGGKQAFAKSLASFKPEIGDFYIFPGWLLHGAEPFIGAGERVSLAFNAFVEIGQG